MMWFISNKSVSIIEPYTGTSTFLNEYQHSHRSPDC